MGLFQVIGFTVSPYKNKPVPIDEITYKLAEKIRNNIYGTLGLKSSVLSAWQSDLRIEPERSKFNELIGFNAIGFADLMYYEDGQRGKSLRLTYQTMVTSTIFWQPTSLKNHISNLTIVGDRINLRS
jgi:hypothetical protein